LKSERKEHLLLSPLGALPWSGFFYFRRAFELALMPSRRAPSLERERKRVREKERKTEKRG
jgi:hypothetical protein